MPNSNILQINTTTNSVQVNQTSVQKVNVVAAGPQGPKGDPGLSTIGGYGFNFSGLTPGDLLSFSGSAWYNRDDESVTDGGNF